MGEVIEGAVQHAPQAVRQSMAWMLSGSSAQTIVPVRLELDNEKYSHWSCLMIKSITFGVLHVGIAFTVSYALTGSVAIAGAITLVEPVVNTVAHYFFDRWWERRARPRSGGGGSVESALPCCTPKLST